MIWIAIGIVIAGYLIAQAIERSNGSKTYREETPIETPPVETAHTEKTQEKYQEKYPHLVGKIENCWLEVFGGLYVEKGMSHLKAAEMMYIKADNNSKQNIEVDFLLCDLWDLTEELLEHLKKYHVGTKYEHEIAIVTYWQIAVTEVDSLVGETNNEVIRKRFQTPPFSDLQEIVSWFPKKKLHPKGEISFVDKKTGSFPRKSKLRK